MYERARFWKRYPRYLQGERCVNAAADSKLATRFDNAHASELLPRVVCELVDGKLVGLVGLGVVVDDVLGPFLECSEAR